MTNNTLIIDDENFWEVFKPEKNHLDEDASYDGCMFETYGKELEYVMSKTKEQIWTILDGDTKTIIASGYHLVNRIGYLICEKPIPNGLEFEVQDETNNIVITAQHILNNSADIMPDMDDGEAQNLLKEMHDEIISDVDYTICERLKQLQSESKNEGD